MDTRRLSNHSLATLTENPLGNPNLWRKKKKVLQGVFSGKGNYNQSFICKYYVLMSGNTNISDISPTKDKRHSDNSNNNNKQQLFFMLSLTEIYCTPKALTLP